MQDELPDTQPVTMEEIMFSQEFDCAWGKLYGNRKGMKSHALMKEVVTVGRAPSCDIIITTSDVKENVYTIISKAHFRISKREREGKMIVVLEDLSFNGTFVNGTRVGKGNSVVLRNNDDICICYNNFHVFLFMDSHTTVEGFVLPQKILSEYVVSRKVGQGSYGVVYSLFRKETDERLAMKIIPKKVPLKNTKAFSSKFESNVNVLKALDHPFVIKVEDVVETEDGVFVVMEMMDGGELASRIQTERPAEHVVKFFFYQIALALKYLHSNGITHRDLKVENILLSSEEMECQVKVADFGLAKLLDENTVMDTFCGSPMYVAPEVLKVRTNGSYTSKVDIWSLGVLLYVCLSASFPFQRTELLDLREDIMRGAYNFPRKTWSGISMDAMNLVRRMMTVDPAMRFNISQVLSHPWLNDKELRTRVQLLMKNSTPEMYVPPTKRCREDGEQLE